MKDADKGREKRGHVIVHKERIKADRAGSGVVLTWTILVASQDIPRKRRGRQHTCGTAFGAEVRFSA